MTSTQQIAQSSDNGTLKEVWKSAMKYYNDGFPSPHEAKLGVAFLARAMGLIQSLSLFSSNETLVDIPTSSLKYLLAPYYMGLLSQRVPPSETFETPTKRDEHRIVVLQRAFPHLLSFIRSMEMLQFLHASDQSIAQALIDSVTARISAPTSTSTSSSSSSSSFLHTQQPPSRDSALLEREVLRERMQRLQQAKSNLKALEERRARLRQSEEADVDAEEDEFEREHWTLMLQVTSIDAVNELKSLLSELDMLRKMVAMSGVTNPNNSSSSSSSLQSSAQKMMPSGRPGPSSAAEPPKIFHISEPGAEPEQLQRLGQKPSTLGAQKKKVAAPPAYPNLAPVRKGFMNAEEAALAVEHASQMRGGGVAPSHVHHQQTKRVATSLQDRIDNQQIIKEAVFLPGWRQPTLMVEEAAEIEMQFAAKGAGGAASGSQEPLSGEDEEDFKANDDESLRKQREWDDWVDYNPTGIGNRKRMG